MKAVLDLESMEKKSTDDLSFEEKISKILNDEYGYKKEDLTYCSDRMGVPITFLDKYCPEQFEIINALNEYIIVGNEDINEDIRKRHSYACNINNVATYFRILIKRKEND